jgi:hypothetical protein
MEKTSIITANLSDCNQSQFLLVSLLDGVEWESVSLYLKTGIENLLPGKLSSCPFPTAGISDFSRNESNRELQVGKC